MHTSTLNIRRLLPDGLHHKKSKQRYDETLKCINEIRVTGKKQVVYPQNKSENLDNLRRFEGQVSLTWLLFLLTDYP